MPRPQTLTLLLLDGEPTGVWVAELHNWDGKALRIPRARARDLATDRPELRHTGIYILITRPDEASERHKVYIGEAEDLGARLRQHLEKRPEWNEVIVFTRKSDELNKAHVKFLESYLYERVQEANRYDLDNGNRPTRSSLHETDRYAMEDFAERVQVITGTLGHNMFIPLRQRPVVATVTAPTEVATFTTTVPESSLIASLIRTNEGYVVLEGSTARVDLVSSANSTLIKLQKRLLDDGSLRQDGEHFRFTRDTLFNSPSGAASLIKGRSTNGWTSWVNAGGLTLAEVFRES